ncbi:DUF2934 domain-containing protein [Rhabdochromatium marinum]|uniref:DUF2934 domain-containing protein n=1 Tax=Rhabdochromatium marinum TaxID=48729 RepID=UPI0019077468|nr:DUF2934 domain-containing protein [Rhabdochromatium marinum]MBK1650083.1 hypothetical protein [Rhabdochromatium marinum]
MSVPVSPSPSPISPSPASPLQNPNDEQRHRMIATAAYYLAERRDFRPGQAERDWMLAEQQIDRMLAERRQAGQSPDTLRDIDIRNALRLLPSR